MEFNSEGQAIAVEIRSAGRHCSRGTGTLKCRALPARYFLASIRLQAYQRRPFQDAYGRRKAAALRGFPAFEGARPAAQEVHLLSLPQRMVT